MDLWDKAVETLKDKHKQNVDFQRTDKNAILVDVLEEVQKKKQACVERRLKYKRKNGEVLVLYDVYEKIVKWVMKFKEVGDVAMQYDPGHAALPWAAIRFFLQVQYHVCRFLDLIKKLITQGHRSPSMMFRYLEAWLKAWRESARLLPVIPSLRAFIFASLHLLGIC